MCHVNLEIWYKLRREFVYGTYELLCGLLHHALRALGFGPGGGGDVFNLTGSHAGEAGEHVAQVGERVYASAAAAFDDGVEDGSALPGVGGSDEHPVFLADGGGADGVFDEVVVDLYSPVLGKGAELRPLVEGVGDGFAEGALGEVFGAEFVQGSVEPLEDGLALELAGKFS